MKNKSGLVFIISNYDSGYHPHELSYSREASLLRIIHRIGKVPIEWLRINFRDLENEDVFCAVLKSQGVILSGSPYNLSIPSHVSLFQKEMNLIQEISKKEIPLLGTCFGHQLIGHTFNAEVKVMEGERYPLEFNKMIEIPVDSTFPLFKDLEGQKNGENTMWVEVNHHDEVIATEEFLEDFDVYSYSIEANVLEIFKHKTRDIYGVQFHPETVLNNIKVEKDGFGIIKNFVDIIIAKLDTGFNPYYQFIFP